MGNAFEPDLFDGAEKRQTQMLGLAPKEGKKEKGEDWAKNNLKKKRGQRGEKEKKNSKNRVDTIQQWSSLA